MFFPLKKLADFILLALLGLFLTYKFNVIMANNVSKQAHDKNFIAHYPQPKYGIGKQGELVRRGEYLTKVGNCISCHTDTKHHGQAFAGGLKFSTQFGNIYAPNITADNETGIGQWSDQDFIRALHDGVSPQGKNYYPVFPYTSYHYVKNQDLLAIKAYLDSIPAIRQQNKPAEMKWPFKWRFLIHGWKMLFFHGDNQYFVPNPKQTAVWNHGAYLVKGLGHCGECHTPRNIFGAMQQDKFLNGAYINGHYAPNINSDGLTGTTLKEIENVFLKDELLHGKGSINGLMATVNQNSLRNLSHTDLVAIASYLKTVKPIKTSRVTLTQTITRETSPDPKTLALGSRIYKKNCAVCHNPGVLGAPKIGDPIAWSPLLKQDLGLLINRTINGYRAMPAKGGCKTCSHSEIIAAVKYMLERTKAND